MAMREDLAALKPLLPKGIEITQKGDQTFLTYTHLKLDKRNITHSSSDQVINILLNRTNDYGHAKGVKQAQQDYRRALGIDPPASISDGDLRNEEPNVLINAKPPTPYGSWLSVFLGTFVSTTPIEDNFKVQIGTNGLPRGTKMWMIKVMAFQELLSTIPTHDNMYKGIDEWVYKSGKPYKGLDDLMKILTTFKVSGANHLLKQESND